MWQTFATFLAGMFYVVFLTVTSDLILELMMCICITVFIIEMGKSATQAIIKEKEDHIKSLKRFQKEIQRIKNDI